MNKGFTFIETLIAAMILMLVVVPVMTVYSSASRAQVRLKDSYLRAMHLENLSLLAESAIKSHDSIESLKAAQTGDMWQFLEAEEKDYKHNGIEYNLTVFDLDTNAGVLSFGGNGFAVQRPIIDELAYDNEVVLEIDDEGLPDGNIIQLTNEMGKTILVDIKSASPEVLIQATNNSDQLMVVDIIHIPEAYSQIKTEAEGGVVVFRYRPRDVSEPPLGVRLEAVSPKGAKSEALRIVY